MHSDERRSRTRIQSKAMLFLLIILASLLLCFQQVYAIPVSNMLEVPYHAQETDYYCGPASVQMGIEYVSGDVIPQTVLATEMKTDPKMGTYTNVMPFSFANRGFFSVRERRYVATDELKTLNSRGFISILDIWFDTDHKSGHYIVVVGYNATGIFINDPWPAQRTQPKSRKTGKSAFVSDSLLADLWSRYNQWVLDIPYGSAIYMITVSVNALPEYYQSRIVVDGTESGLIKTGESRSLSFKVGTSHTISVDQYISGPEGTRYFCVANSWPFSSGGTHSFSYSSQYRLDVSSPYGTVSGSSWYDAGSTATLSVTPTEVSISGFVGLLGAKIVFDRWSGDLTATTGRATIIMNSPKKVVAVWREDYTQPYVMLVVIIAVAVVLAAVLFMKKRKAVPVALPPPPPPTAAAPAKKYCIQCGAEMPVDATWCPTCGEPATDT